MNWQAYLPRYEQQYKLPSGLLAALIRAESGGNPNAISPAGAIGLGQLMPATAASLGVNPRNPVENLRGAAMYLSQQLRAFGGDPAKALAAYNAGPGAVKRYNGIPPYSETRNYVKRVQDYWKQSGSQGLGGLGSPQNGSQGALNARQVPGLDPGSIARLQHAYIDAPEIGAAVIQNRMDQQNEYDQAPSLGGSGSGGLGPGAKGFFRTPKGLIRNRLPGELGYQFLQRLGNKGFGLRNDLGITQTYGGRHTAGSLHYDKRAVDWGNALNSNALLNQFYDWLKPRQKSVGIQELIWQAPGHYDHLHAGVR